MLSSRRVLVFDDDDESRQTLCQSVAGEGYDLRFAVAPMQALAVLSSMPVDIIIANQEMADMSGLALLEFTRARHPACLRMLMTEDPELQAVANTVTKNLVFRILLRPLNPTELLASLRAGCELLDLRRENEHPDAEQVLETDRRSTRVHILQWGLKGALHQGGKP